LTALDDEKEKNFLHFPTIDIRFDAKHALAPNPWADKIKRSKQG
jgi:hypothetical protein